MQIGYNDNFQIKIILTWQETRQITFWYTFFPFMTKNFLEIKLYGSENMLFQQWTVAMETKFRLPKLDVLA